MEANLEIDKVSDERWMREALKHAREAAAANEVPVGALVVRNDELLGAGFNQPIRSCDATAHAEIVALRKASLACDNYRLPGTTLYVTLEPCTMCLGALIHARVERLVFGAAEPRAGAVISRASLLEVDHFNHRLSFTSGVLADECSSLLTDFFRRRRKGGNGSV